MEAYFNHHTLDKNVFKCVKQAGIFEQPVNGEMCANQPCLIAWLVLLWNKAAEKKKQNNNLHSTPLFFSKVVSSNETGGIDNLVAAISCILIYVLLYYHQLNQIVHTTAF